MKKSCVCALFAIGVTMLMLVPAAGAQGTAQVTGTLTYRQRIALPPNAEVLVQLVDVSLADAPATVLAEQRTTTNGEQVPLPFTLTYDPARIQQNGTYAVQASITIEGQLRFRTTSQYRVITQGYPTTVDLVLDQINTAPAPTPAPTSPSPAPTPPSPAPTPAPQPVPQASLPSAMLDRDWTLVSLQRAPGNVSDTRGSKITIHFGSDGRVGGSGGCNSFSATYTAGANNSLTIGQVLSTLIGCEPKITTLEQAYFQALQSVTSYALAGSSLQLSFNNGQGVLLYSMSSASSQDVCFTETSYCVSGRFSTYWGENGGLSVFGYPLSNALTENGRSVQYFERQRFELHSENAAPYDVLLGLLGDELLQRQGVDWKTLPKASGAQTGCQYFAETQHNVCNTSGGPSFLSYWRSNGLEFDGRRGKSAAESLALFGMPISEPFETTIEGQQVLVQWFERARFEWHPNNPAAYRVQLGRLGAELHGDAPLAGTPNTGGASATVSVQRSDNGKSFTMATGQTLVVALDSNPSTGYTWQVKEVNSAVLQQQGEPEYTPGGTMPGSPGTLTFRFRAGAGQTTLTLVYVRPFEPEVQPTPENTFTISVTVR